MIQFKFIIHSLIISSVTFASGGWISGGGELLKNSHNPWFLNNTKDVYYCVKVNESDFGVSRKTIESKLVSAIKFWKAEFNYAITPEFKRISKLRIANQNFMQVSCNDLRVDIKFQFGFLEKAQKEYLKDSKKFAAVTVRTSYDEVNLKGKGFVYVSPSHGPLAYNQEGVVEEAWKSNDGDLLYLTLVHELGHIFGLPHIGTMGALMSEGFVEMILIQNNNLNFKNDKFNFFTLVSKSHVICPQQSLLEVWTAFFDLSPNEKCLQFNFKHDFNNQFWGTTTLEVISVNSQGSFIRNVEDIELKIYKFNPVYPGVIWLSESQRLFDKAEYINGVQGVLGVSLVSVSKKGTFVSKKTGLKKSLSVKFEQGKAGFSLDGVNEYSDFVTLF